MRSYSEYIDLIENLQRKARIARIAEVANAKAMILEIMRTHGLAVIESRGRLEIGEKPIAQAKLKPRYRDPATGKTWAGRGRTPRWLEGRNKAEFLIDRNAQ